MCIAKWCHSHKRRARRQIPILQRPGGWRSLEWTEGNSLHCNYVFAVLDWPFCHSVKPAAKFFVLLALLPLIFWIWWAATWKKGEVRGLFWILHRANHSPFCKWFKFVLVGKTVQIKCKLQETTDSIRKSVNKYMSEIFSSVSHVRPSYHYFFHRFCLMLAKGSPGIWGSANLAQTSQTNLLFWDYFR